MFLEVALCRKVKPNEKRQESRGVFLLLIDSVQRDLLLCWVVAACWWVWVFLGLESVYTTTHIYVTQCGTCVTVTERTGATTHCHATSRSLWNSVWAALEVGPGGPWAQCSVRLPFLSPWRQCCLRLEAGAAVRFQCVCICPLTLLRNKHHFREIRFPLIFLGSPLCSSVFFVCWSDKNWIFFFFSCLCSLCHFGRSQPSLEASSLPLYRGLF